MKTIVLILIGLSCLAGAQLQPSDKEAVDYARHLVVGIKPVVRDGGYVPDQATAIRITIAVLIPIYGKKLAYGEKPWRAGLEGDVWTVVGTFHGEGEGGEAIVQLSKTSGAVLFVTHTM
jgi:hypothetical protein